MGLIFKSVRTRFLTCACCNGHAGRWQQWHNQDTGFGLCARCADWIHRRGMDAATLTQTYGKAGIHREAAAFEKGA